MSNNLIFLLSLPKTILFNFRYLPFRQAIKLPIWLYKVNLVRLKGKVNIDSPYIKPGMIKLGIIANPMYNTKHSLAWQHSGTITFKGTCLLGHGSGVSTGRNGEIVIGDNFIATTTIKLICFKKIEIGNNVRIAWESILMDTDFHETVEIATGERSLPLKPIKIGNNNWIGIQSLILKGTETPDYCIFAARSILTKKYDFPEYSLIAGTPPKLVKQGIYRDLESYVE